MAEFDLGDRFQARERRLDNPALGDKMVRRSISRREIDAVLTDNEIIEVYEHDDRVRYVLLGHVDERPLHLVVGQDDIIDATESDLDLRTGRSARLGPCKRVPRPQGGRR